MGIGFNLFMVALLILLTAFFVATEFAIIRLRSSRIDQLVLEGRKNALAVQRVTSNLDAYLSACQLGITITALGLGWLGEPTVEKMLLPLFERFELNSDISHILSFIIAFVSVTFLHVVVGELAPKTWAIQKAEFISFLTAKPIIFFHTIMYPFIWLLNGSANEQYTRFPVALESKDNIVGMINTKQLFLEYESNSNFEFKKLVHPVLSVSEVTPVKSLLKRMQQERVHIAILVDEYGGTSGLITIEDILEEIVGEIRDEFDADERKDVEQLADNCYLLDGKVSLDELADLTGTIFEDEDVDTVGGWLYSQVQDPKPGKEHHYENLMFIIRETSKNRIRKVEMLIQQNEPVVEGELA
ncbi:hemolysin family protein [Paenibacillus sp. MCAF20]